MKPYHLKIISQMDTYEKLLKIHIKLLQDSWTMYAILKWILTCKIECNFCKARLWAQKRLQEAQSFLSMHYGHLYNGTYQFAQFQKEWCFKSNRNPILTTS
jgi:hypothetical protein